MVTTPKPEIKIDPLDSIRIVIDNGVKDYHFIPIKGQIGYKVNRKTWNQIKKALYIDAHPAMLVDRKPKR